MRTRTKQLGAKEKARRKQGDVRFSSARKKSNLQQKLHEDWCEEVVEDGFGPCDSVGRSSRWHLACRKTEVEKADCSSRQERVGVVISLHGN